MQKERMEEFSLVPGTWHSESSSRLCVVGADPVVESFETTVRHSSGDFGNKDVLGAFD